MILVVQCGRGESKGLIYVPCPLKHQKGPDNLNEEPHQTAVGVLLQNYQGEKTEAVEIGHDSFDYGPQTQVFLRPALFGDDA